MTAAVPPLARIGPAVVTGGLVLFAGWTLAYELALLTGLRAVPTLLVGLLAGVVVLVTLRRLPGAATEHVVALPGLRATVAVVVLALAATCLALLGHRALAVGLGVIGAGVGLVDAFRRSDSSPREAVPADGSVPDEDVLADSRLWVVGWSAALVSGGLASVVVRPDGDDAYFVNLSTWVAERGSFPLRDTMISPDRFPALSSHSPPIHSVEALIGTVARVLGIEAGTAAYVLVPPVATVFAVLVLTWVVERAHIPAAPMAVLAAVGFLWTAGSTGYGFGNFFAVRIWQGKAMLVAIALPLVLVLGARLLRRGAPRHHVLFGAAVVAGLGMSNTATFVLPVMIAGLVLAALALREFRGAARLVLWSLLPLLAGVVAVVLAPATPTGADLAAEGFTAGVADQVRDPLTTVPGGSGVLAITALAIGAGVLGIRERTWRTATLGTIVAGGIALLPPVRGLFDVVGLESVLWRMWWILPVPVLVAGLVGAVAGRVRAPRTRALAAVAAAAVVATAPLVNGWWVGSERNGARIAMPLTWKVPKGVLAEARFVERISEPGDTALVPWDTSRVLSALTVDVQPVAARRAYLAAYAATPEARSGSRLELQEFADEHTPDTNSIADDLDAVGVDTACVGRSRGRAVDLLEANGFQVVGSLGTVTCLRR